MKQFASALVVATAAASSFVDYTIRVDGSDVTRSLSYKDWSTADVTGSTLTIGGNNSLFMRTERSMHNDAIFKPLIRGGKIEYDVNVSGQAGGCVAGAYLVNTDDGQCSEDSHRSAPQCKSIDIM